MGNTTHKPLDVTLQPRPVVSRQYYTPQGGNGGGGEGPGVKRRTSAPPVSLGLESPRFHPQAKGKNIRLDGQLRRATRKNSFCNGITFSQRPIRLYEKVCLRLSGVHNGWSGALRFGFTSLDPSELNCSNIPKYACPDLVTRSGYWAKALPERLAVRDNILSFWADRHGRVFYSINEGEPILFHCGLSAGCPLWAIIDIYGLTQEVTLLESKFAESVGSSCLSAAHLSAYLPQSSHDSANYSNNQLENNQAAAKMATLQLNSQATANMATLQLNSQATANMATLQLNSQATANMATLQLNSQATANMATLQLNNQATAMMATLQLNNQATTKISTLQLNNQATAMMATLQLNNYSSNTLNNYSQLIPCCTTYSSSTTSSSSVPFSAPRLVRAGLPSPLDTDLHFHPVRGPDVILSADRTAVCTHFLESSRTLVFSDRPLRVRETLYVEVGHLGLPYFGALLFGLTSCDPGSLHAGELPANPEVLLDRKEYWVVYRGFPMPCSGDVLSFSLTPSGEVHHGVNGAARGRLLCVDSSQTLWAFFTLHGAVNRLRILGTLQSSPSSPSSPSSQSSSSGPDDSDSDPAFSVNRSSSESSLVTASSSPLSPPVSPPLSAPELPGGKNGECTVCFDQEVDTVIYTCGHMCLCNDCGLKLKRQVNACCPICRRPIKDVIKTYRP
ncbi:E3 ubiquitin-protein ligase NEURL1B isoform X2 [Coregonus clupeaformis]|uniref:E3 ubiquitin-protein ligase NEURL1B isoform X2 n=1 Tax=Coregonus clupeaformis TaxID=59861 RepID=UPI001E1C5445|nr:E3 ubiquitin-protein ligase NEURL1B isoform X2 [Coregonus clupeaformis]